MMKNKGRKFEKSAAVDVTFENVAGLQSAKRDLQEIVQFLKEPEKFRRLGGKVPRGVLLIGPPGTGKTLLARSLAEHLQDRVGPFVHVMFPLMPSDQLLAYFASALAFAASRAQAAAVLDLWQHRDTLTGRDVAFVLDCVCIESDARRSA